MSVGGPTGVLLLDFFYSGIQSYILLSPYLFYPFLYLDLYSLGDDYTVKLGIFHANQISICLDLYQK